MRRFEKVDCRPQNATALVEYNFRQACLRKFEFWRGQLKLDKFRKSIGEVFCKIDCLDRLVFLFPRSAVT